MSDILAICGNVEREVVVPASSGSTPFHPHGKAETYPIIRNVAGPCLDSIMTVMNVDEQWLFFYWLVIFGAKFKSVRE